MLKQIDIARKTGHSLSAVSRALSGTKGKNDTVSEETRVYIRRIAEEMGYKPNLHASCLRKKKLPVIGVFLPSWGGQLIAELVMGISDAAAKCEISLNFRFDMSLSSYGKFLDDMKDCGNSGILSYVPQLDDGPDPEISKKLQSYRDSGGNIFLLNTLCFPTSELPHVSIDEEYGGKLAADFLSQCACARLISFSYSGRLYHKRIFGFKAALAGMNLTAKDYELFGPGEHNEREFFFKATEAIFDSVNRKNRPGVFLTSDGFARYFIYFAERKGLQAEKDFFLVSYDSPLTEKEPYEPPRIIQPFYQIGFKGFMKLYNHINGGKEESEIILPQLWLNSGK